MTSDRSVPLGDKTILAGADPEFISDLSEYLDVLASPVRLHILSYVGTRSRTVRQIAHEIKTSYENTKKHLTKLLSLGLIRKEIGVSDEPMNQGQPVFYYSLVPGSLDHAVRNLAAFSSVAESAAPALSPQLTSTHAQILEAMGYSVPVLIVITGTQNGHEFILKEDAYRIGRIEEEWDGMNPEPALILNDEYRSVSRVSRPHAWIRLRAGSWTITDGPSKGGTHVQGERISAEPRVLLDGDMIELSPGPLGVRLIFHSKKSGSPECLQ